MNSNKKSLKIFGITIWRICAYLIIYSVIGFIIETLYAILLYNVLESRKSFLYGPFCAIYGIGATLMILFIKKYFNKNNYTLFLGGFVIGSIVEYTINYLGELTTSVKWWDYSNQFLNINGRICLLYSFLWGILSIFIIKFFNPKIDKFLNWLKQKFNPKLSKLIIIFSIIFLLIDYIITGVAISLCLLRKSVENNLNIKNKEKAQKLYSYIYNNEKLSDFINYFWNDNKMLITFPNLNILLQDGTIVYIKNLTPNVKTYYYKFK